MSIRKKWLKERIRKHQGRVVELCKELQEIESKELFDYFILNFRPEQRQVLLLIEKYLFEKKEYLKFDGWVGIKFYDSTTAKQIE